MADRDPTAPTNSSPPTKVVGGLSKEELWQLAKAKRNPQPDPAPAPKRKLRVKIKRLSPSVQEHQNGPESGEESGASWDETTASEMVIDDADGGEIGDVDEGHGPEINSTPPEQAETESTGVAGVQQQVEGEVVAAATDVKPHDKDDSQELVEKPELRTAFRQYWDTIGGGSLAFSVGLHLVILLVAGFIVFTSVSEKRIDFLPGGGTQQGERRRKI